jgi:hypothetical protein
MTANGCAQARQPKEAGPWIGAAGSKGKRAGGTWWSGPGLGGWPSGGMDGVEQWLARREQGPVTIGVAARCRLGKMIVEADRWGQHKAGHGQTGNTCQVGGSDLLRKKGFQKSINCLPFNAE